MLRRVLPLSLLVVLAGCAPATPNPQPQTAAPDADTTANVIVETADPEGFVAQINNPYLPITPGLTYLYDGTVDGGDYHIEIFVTHETRTIEDIVCNVVRETHSVNGQQTEQTLNCYAQDLAGNVWNLAQEGLWEAGVDGAEGGIVMLAFPKVGDTYQQENAAGKAEDQAEVLSLTESVATTFSTFDNALKIAETSPLEAGRVENRYYAAGIGLVMLEIGEGRVGLTEIQVAPPSQ